MFSYSAFYSIQALNGMEAANHIGRAICFPQSSDSNVNLIRKHPHGHTQKLHLTKYMDAPWSSQVDIKLTITELELSTILENVYLKLLTLQDGYNWYFFPH